MRLVAGRSLGAEIRHAPQRRRRLDLDFEEMRYMENTTGRSGHSLTNEERRRGGLNSAAEQTRDAHGQFAGKASRVRREQEQMGQPGNGQQRHGPLQ